MHVRSCVRRVVRAAAAIGCSLPLFATGADAGASVASPTVTAASGGAGVAKVPGFTSFDPAEVGYRQSELFLTGTAHAYAAAAPFGADGKLAVAPASSAPFTTRIVVMRPVKPGRFNGTVVVEWFNVSGGADAGPDWTLAHNQLIREGFAYVGVSAQKVGLDALKGNDPLRGDAARYAGLSHPGDSFSYDVYSQAGQAIRDQADVVLGGLRPKRLLAVGESQSAIRMTTYIDAVHPVAGVYDGFLVHSRFTGGAPVSQAPEPNVPVPSPLPIRDDLDVPVLVFMTENDVSFSGATARQPDTDRYRLWEVAGTSHYDYYGLSIGKTDTGDGQGAVQMLASMQAPTNQPNPNFSCATPINTGPAHFVLDAAFSALHRWVAAGVAPSKAPRLEVATTGPVTFATDANGNVRGGIRTPPVDAPVATLSGLGQAGNSFCFLFGTTVPLTPEQLGALYANHRQFVSAWTKSANAARRAGFLVDEDAAELVAAAKLSDIGK